MNPAEPVGGFVSPPLAVVLALAALAVLAWPGADQPWMPRAGRGPGHRARWPIGGLEGSGTGVAAHGAPAGSVGMPEVLDLVALSLLGGGSLAGGLQAAARVLPEDEGQVLGQAGAALAAGRALPPDVDTPGGRWEPLRRCVLLAEVSGVPPATALRSTATDLRREAVADIEVAAARLGVRLVVPLGVCFLPAFVLMTVAPLVLALAQDVQW